METTQPLWATQYPNKIFTGKSISPTLLLKRYILLLYILKSKRMKENWKTSPSHSIFIFHTFSFSLVELYKNYQCEAFHTCDPKYICLKMNRVLLQIQDISLNSCILTYLRPLGLHTLVPDICPQCVIAIIIAPAWCVSPACCSPCGPLWMNTIAQLTFPLF